MIDIERFTKTDEDDIIALVLHFQNDGSRPIVTVKDQPDLLDIEKEYFQTGGYFWVAKDKNKIVGSIGLMPYNDGTAILKKFFVYEAYQGKPCHVGRKLYSTLLTYAKEKKFKTILLDTPCNTHRAHDFYNKAGFSKILEDELPIKFSHPYKDCDFFILILKELLAHEYK